MARGIRLFAALLSVLASFPFYARAEEHVWVVLSAHGSPKMTPESLQKYAEASAAFADGELSRRGVGLSRPLVLWFERAAPLELFYSLAEPEKFYAEIQKETGISPEDFQNRLIGFGAAKEESIQAVRTMEKIFHEHEARYLKTGEMDRARPRVFVPWIERLKKTRRVSSLYEKAHFEAWLALVRANIWAGRMFSEIEAGSLEEAMRSCLRYYILVNLSNQIRDKRLAEDIKHSLSRNPGALHLVVRGAMHERTAAYLNQMGIPARNVQHFDFREASAAPDFLAGFRPPADFNGPFEMSAEEKNLAARSMIEELSTYFLLSQGIDPFLDSAKRFKIHRAAEGLDARALEEWGGLIRRPGPAGEKMRATWDWLLTKSRTLETAFK